MRTLLGIILNGRGILALFSTMRKSEGQRDEVLDEHEAWDGVYGVHDRINGGDLWDMDMMLRLRS